MARKPRFIAPMQAHLLSQSALDQVELFRFGEDFGNFLELLKISAKVNHVAIHAYALLAKEIFLVATPADADGLSRFMQWVGRRYVPYYNKKYGRSGSLWRARFRAAAVDGASELVNASLFVEEAALRAGLCSQAQDYVWSSCRAHAGAARDPLLTDHPSYWALGNTPFEREMAYQRRLEQGLSSQDAARMEAALRAGWAIGPKFFAESLEKESGRRLSPGRRGRPPSKGASPSPKEGDMSPIKSSIKPEHN